LKHSTRWKFPSIARSTAPTPISRAVVAPYAGGHESEQTLRAHALAERGALQVVAEDDLSPERLAAAIDQALAGPPLSTAGIDLGGVPATVTLLQGLHGR
jgi:predicted glycosyltransferase